MAGAQDGFPADDEIAELIQIKARKFAASRRISQQDFEDLVQGLWLQLLRQRRRFDRSRAAAATFIDRVLESKGMTMIESLETKRQGILRHARPLEQPLHQGDEEGLTLAETYSEDDYFRDTGFGSPPQDGLIETRIDIESALRSVDPEMRQLAERLKVMTPAEIERQYRIPHATLHDRIRTLGRLLAATGLADYVPAPRKKTGRRPDRFRGDPVCNDQGMWDREGS